MDITEQLTHESRIALAAAAEITRLRAEVEAERTNAALARAFHDVAVQQRNAAWSESDRLRAEVEALRDANERLNVAVAEAERIVRAYARRNPRHEYKGVIQDPFGAHGWLDRFDAARAAQGGERG